VRPRRHDVGVQHLLNKNQILRYVSNGSGGIATNPVVVFTLDANTATNNGVTPGQWSGFRWAHIRVRAAGTNTMILAGGIGARGVWLLTTTDGSTSRPVPT